MTDSAFSPSVNLDADFNRPWACRPSVSFHDVFDLYHLYLHELRNQDGVSNDLAVYLAVGYAKRFTNRLNAESKSLLATFLKWQNETIKDKTVTCHPEYLNNLDSALEHVYYLIRLNFARHGNEREAVLTATSHGRGKLAETVMQANDLEKFLEILTDFEVLFAPPSRKSLQGASARLRELRAQLERMPKEALGTRSMDNAAWDIAENRLAEQKAKLRIRIACGERHYRVQQARRRALQEAAHEAQQSAE